VSPHPEFPAAKHPTHVFQIGYDAASKAKVEASGFRLLDNLQNARPDWYEYWPIRRFLLDNTLQQDAWYGFFSPRFQEKTGLNAAAVDGVIAALERRKPDLEIVLFSPQPDMGAFFLNVFEQGEMFHPGLMEVSRQVLKEVGFDVPIETLVMDSRQIVFSNYFVAKPAFWRAWLEVTEAIFRIAEDPAHPLYAALNAGTSYRDGSHQKVFVVERIASLLLTVQSHWKTTSADTFSFAWSSFPSFNVKRELAYQSDALKMAFRECGHAYYMQAYSDIRQRIGT
jgi:hypothetical protein